MKGKNEEDGTAKEATNRAVTGPEKSSKKLIKRNKKQERSPLVQTPKPDSSAYLHPPRASIDARWMSRSGVRGS